MYFTYLAMTGFDLITSMMDDNYQNSCVRTIVLLLRNIYFKFVVNMYYSVDACYAVSNMVKCKLYWVFFKKLFSNNYN